MDTICVSSDRAGAVQRDLRGDREVDPPAAGPGSARRDLNDDRPLGHEGFEIMDLKLRDTLALVTGSTKRGIGPEEVRT
jgi:hypothetical protein